MKRLFSSFLSCFFALILSVSCSFSAPLSVRLADVVQYAENIQNISDEEWEAVKEDYFLLTEEFRANVSAFTEEEKQEIYHLMGRMNGLMAKRETGERMNEIYEISNSLPSLIEGFVQGLSGENN